MDWPVVNKAAVRNNLILREDMLDPTYRRYLFNPITGELELIFRDGGWCLPNEPTTKETRAKMPPRVKKEPKPVALSIYKQFKFVDQNGNEYDTVKALIDTLDTKAQPYSVFQKDRKFMGRVWLSDGSGIWCHRVYLETDEDLLKYGKIVEGKKYIRDPMPDNFYYITEDLVPTFMKHAVIMEEYLNSNESKAPTSYKLLKYNPLVLEDGRKFYSSAEVKKKLPTSYDPKRLTERG